jgi:triosephosphate isomerase (TIM)
MDKKILWIIANWKSNKTLVEALEWVEEVGPSIEKRDYLKVVVCPPFEYLEEVQKAIKIGNYPLMVGSQDLSPFPEGSFTGEESAQMLKQFVSLAILGHSERRQNFHETDQLVAKKVLEAKKNEIIPLVCVQDENTPVPEGCHLVAYEPPNSISSSGPNAQADDPADTEKVALSLKEKYGQVEVLYGGSVAPENALAFVKQDQISGLLIGKASLEADSFIKIVEEVQRL